MSFNRIGIIGAMPNEIAKLRKRLVDMKTEKRGAWHFYIGKLCGKEVVLVQSGLCKVNMAACTQAIIDYYEVDCLINSGIAGGVSPAVNIGDIVISRDCLQHDVDAVVFGYKPGQIPQMKTTTFKADETLVAAARAACKKVYPEVNMFSGRILTGDVFICERQKKDDLLDTFGGICTEMEGAAMGQVAHINKVPFVIVRTISDNADDSAGMVYEEFEVLAIERMVEITTELVAQL